MRVMESGLDRYLADESRSLAGRASRVLFPATEDEVAGILSRSSREQVPLTVYGGGTSLTGASVACGGDVLGMEDLELPGGGRIQVDLDGMRARVAASAYLKDLDAALTAAGLFYPPDSTERTATIGGNIATNASGARSYRYGATRSWVESLRLVLPGGERLAVHRGEVKAKGRVLEVRGEQGGHYQLTVPSYAMPQTKHAAGLYAADGMDLLDLVVGSEGILGVVTEAEIRLVPLPEIRGIMAFFPSEEAALSYADGLRASKSLASIEYLDDSCLRLMRDDKALRRAGIAAKGPLHAVFTETAEDAYGLLDGQMQLHGSVGSWVAETPAQLREQKAFRHRLPAGINEAVAAVGKLGTDFAVPAARFREMMAIYREARDDFERRFPRQGPGTALFGHLGDYHLHFNFLCRDGTELLYAKGAYAGMALEAVRLGGTLSAEHGVGKKALRIGERNVPYLEVMYGPAAIEEVAAAKRVVDPDMILNRGNMVPFPVHFTRH